MKHALSIVFLCLFLCARLAAAGDSCTILSSRAPLTVAAGGAGESFPDTNGLIAYYKLNGSLKDEISGQNASWYNGSGPPYDYPPPPVVTQYMGWTLAYTPVNTRYIQLVDVDLLNGATGCTIAVWAYHRSDYTYAYQALLYSRGTQRHGLATHDTGLNMDGMVNASSSQQWTIPQNTWIHLAQTWRLGEAVSLYTNGYLHSTGSVMTNAIVQDDYFKTFDDAGTSTRTWNGRISQILIYNRKLSATDILAMYNQHY